MSLSEVFLLERHLIDHEFSPTQVFKDPCVSGEVEAEPVRIERLVRFAVFAVDAAVSVLTVAEQGMSESSERGADLMVYV